jgi:putative MATE family efflux protein
MAAVNLVAPVLLALGAVSTAIGVGGASLVSRSLGADDPAAAGRAAGNAFVVFYTIAGFVTVVGLLALDPLLTVLGARAGTRDMAGQYAIVILSGAVLSTGFSSLVRAEGRMVFSTMLWLVPVLVQILLDPLLIFGLHLGVRGAALGTVGGQFVSAAMSMWFFFLQRRRPYRIGLAGLRLHAPTVRALLDIGAPSFLSGLGATLIAVIVNSMLSGLGGTVALTVYAVCLRVQTFVTMPQLGISQGLQPVVGYNAGRRLHERVLRARMLSLRATVIYGALASVVVFLLSGPLVALFLGDAHMASIAQDALRIVAVGFTAAGVPLLVSAYFQALGRPGPSYLISIGTLLAIRVPFVVAASHAGITGVCAGLSAGQLVSALAALIILQRFRNLAARASPAIAAP